MRLDVIATSFLLAMTEKGLPLVRFGVLSVLFEVGVVSFEHASVEVQDFAGVVLRFVTEDFACFVEREDVPGVVAHGENDGVHQRVGSIDGLHVNLRCVTM